jgi:hypothetical protein
MTTLHHLSINPAYKTASVLKLSALLVLCTLAAAPSAFAALNTAAPVVFSLNVAAGGTVSTTASSVPAAFTGARVAIANTCSALIVGSAPGVSPAATCAPATVFGTTNVGASISSNSPQTFSANFTAAQLSGIITTLAAAGQPLGSRRFFINVQYAAVSLPAPSTGSFVTLQVDLIEPPVPAPPVAAGITNATASLVDVALNAPSPISVRYTLSGTDSPLAGQFCSALNAGYPASGVATGNPCAPASLIGSAGPAIGFNNVAQTGETLVVPETVARQATARAQASGNSIFYFTRQFSSGKYAVVQLRLNGNAANVPLAFNDIRLGFKDGGSLQNIGFFKRGQVLPPVSAALRYRGAGVLRARWEIVQPTDTPPNTLDLQPEAAITPLQRAQQHRYRVLERVNIYLPATGQAVLSGPNPRLLPNEQYGQYLLLLRIETSDSIAGQPAANTAFALPVLRYYIGESSGPSGQANAIKTEPQTINLVSPQAAAVLTNDAPITFQWQDNKNVSLYRVEIEANGKQVFAARVRASAAQSGADTTIRYTAPPFIASTLANKAARWRVVALASDGQFVGESEWREIANAP